MRIKEGLITRKINDFYGVVYINKKVLDFSCMMTIIAQMRDIYDVSQEQAKKDIELFIKKLEHHDLLIK